MYMSLIAIGIVLMLGYLWLTRGFFSALIHMICTLIAGAVAFGVWEPASYWLISVSPARGFASFLEGTAWALGLAIPFAITLGALRFGVDALLKANIHLPQAANWVGGGLCGAISGVITAGIVVISLGFLRMDKDFLGHEPVASQTSGAVQRQAGLWIPVDKLTAAIYGHASKNSLYVEDDLATLYPDLDVVPASLRINYGGGKARNTIRPEQFSVMGRYTVGQGKNLAPKDLTADRWNPAVHTFSDLRGENPAPGSHLEGYAIVFRSGAREAADGKVVIGNAQVRLVVRNEQTGEVRTVFPAALICQAEASTLAIARFRFDAKELFIASPGAASESPFAIEFIVPPGFAGYALYVKNVRHMVAAGSTANPAFKFDRPEDRDNAIASGAVLSLLGESLSSMARGADGSVAAAASTSTASDGPASIRRDQTGGFYPGLNVSNTLNKTLHKTTVRELTLGDTNEIKDGIQKFSQEELKNVPLERSLQVRQFDITSDTLMVQVDVSLGSKLSWLGQAAQSVEDILPVQLVDTLGTRYDPIGYIYENKGSNYYEIRFTPGQTMRALKEVPNLSRSRPDDKLTLLYRVSQGRTLQSFNVGNKVISTFDPPAKMDGSQRLSK